MFAEHIQHYRLVPMMKGCVLACSGVEVQQSDDLFWALIAFHLLYCPSLYCSPCISRILRLPSQLLSPQEDRQGVHPESPHPTTLTCTFWSVSYHSSNNALGFKPPNL